MHPGRPSAGSRRCAAGAAPTLPLPPTGPPWPPPRETSSAAPDGTPPDRQRRRAMSGGECAPREGVRVGHFKRIRVAPPALCPPDSPTTQPRIRSMDCHYLVRPTSSGWKEGWCARRSWRSTSPARQEPDAILRLSGQNINHQRRYVGNVSPPAHIQHLP
eukprot:scaffold3273_cov363-Prasinococcus_capsulatus_cf.AAC.2